MKTITRHPVWAFFALTFLFAWAIWIPAGLFAPGLFIPATLLGAWAPTLAALLLTALAEGRAGLRAFVSRLFLWRVGWSWYAVALFSIAAILFGAIGLNLALGGNWPTLQYPPGVPAHAWFVVLPMLFVINIFVGGPLAEDVGWRGYALPKLGARVGMLNASLIIGAVWAVWHAPFFLFVAGQQLVGGIPFVWFALLTTAWSVLFAWVYVNTHKSILMPVLYHAAINTTLGSTDVLGFEQGQGSSQLLILMAALTWAVVLVIVVTHGQSLGRAPDKRVFGSVLSKTGELGHDKAGL